MADNGGGYIYVFDFSDGDKVKIGHGDPPARLHALSVTDELRFRAAVPGIVSQERGIHAHFRAQWIRRETFRNEGELAAWLLWLDRQPFVAHEMSELDDAYAPPDWLPWEETYTPTLDTQTMLPLDAGEWERTRGATPREVLQHVRMLSSDADDWYTPSLYVEAARRVMGGIDLDPASSAKANNHVRAARIITARENGLTKPWHGRVWLNPPYGGYQEKFITYLLAEHEAGRVEQAVLLV